ncbi:YHS domain-containing protein [Sphingopyxis chilensis]
MMQDIGQSWIWIVIAVGILAFFFLRRGRRSHGGFGDGGHGHGGLEGLGGFGHGGHGHHGDHGRDDEDRTHPASQQSVEAAIDPVSGSAIPTAGAITSIYQGKAYYFASKENRDRFEAAPLDFAGKVQGVPIGGGESAERPRRRHHGC